MHTLNKFLSILFSLLFVGSIAQAQQQAQPTPLEAILYNAMLRPYAVIRLLTDRCCATMLFQLPR